MIYITLKHLKPDMTLGKDVFFGPSVSPLITTGQKLTLSMIEKLEKYHIPGVYIRSGIGDDIEINDFLIPEFKNETVTKLKTVFQSCASKKSLSSAMAQSILDIAENLIEYVLCKDECLFNMIDIKDYDNYTYTHSMYVGILSVLTGIQMGYNPKTLARLASAGLFHDIGKLDIPIEITNKKGPLSPSEMRIMKTHPEKAIARLRPCTEIPPIVLQGVLSHHERFDGTGYPKGTKGKNIPEFGRILALTDVYDALTSQRSYRKSWFPSEAVEYMMGGAETHFDYDVLQAFLKTVAAYPNGTIVLLSNGDTAIVVKNNLNNALRPKIRLLQPPEKLGKEINLASNTQYLNVTISGLLDDNTQLPAGLFDF